LNISFSVTTPIELSACTALKSVCLRGDSKESHVVLRNIAATLETVRAPSLECLVIYVFYEVALDEWEHICAALQQPAFRKLAELRFRVFGNSLLRDNVAERLRKSCPYRNFIVTF
jgi:hypothetical protein